MCPPIALLLFYHLLPLLLFILFLFNFIFVMWIAENKSRFMKYLQLSICHNRISVGWEFGCMTAKSPVLINLVVKTNKEFHTLKKVSHIPESNLWSYLFSALDGRMVWCAFIFRGFQALNIAFCYRSVTVETSWQHAALPSAFSTHSPGNSKQAIHFVLLPTWAQYMTQQELHYCGHYISLMVTDWWFKKHQVHNWSMCSLSEDNASVTFLDTGVHGFGCPPKG